MKKENAEAREIYKTLEPIVKDIVNKRAGYIDSIIKKVSKNIDTLTDEEIRKYMLELSIESYSFSDAKEYSGLMQECANALLKEKTALEYLNLSGTQEAKKQGAALNTTDRQLVSILYSSVSSIFKTKLDEAHRVSNTLANILISRAAQKKLENK